MKVYCLGQSRFQSIGIIMGVCKGTTYCGSFTFQPALSSEQIKYLMYFDYGNDDFENRDKTMDPPDFPAGLPDNLDEIDCGWMPSDDGTQLFWEERETNSSASEWLNYLVNTLFATWKIKVNGTIKYYDMTDCFSGSLIIKTSESGFKNTIIRTSKPI